MSILRFVALIATIGLAGCAGSGPYRSAADEYLGQKFEDQCQALYRDTDSRIKSIATDFEKTDDDRTAFLKTMHHEIKTTNQDLKPCWKTAYEHHDTYDLYYAEFDDAGQATDIARGVPYEKSELHLIERSLLDRVYPKGGGAPEALDIVVFTHGWHGNARADNNYSIEFKGVLQDIADREREEQSSPTKLAGRLEHHVVGVEIAWRGDSFLNPPLFYQPSKNSLNVWDRKNAAQTVSMGGTQELFAFLNELYVDNSCHGPERNRLQQGPNCDRIHLLSLGHSFGALINFQALIARLESGLNVRPCYRAYGYGDMTVLLNPAFEGARYRSLFSNAKNREALIGPYFDSTHLVGCGPATTANQENFVQREVQIPTLVILQSLGDTATGDFFPLLQAVTTPFAKTLSPAEDTDKDNAVGWITEFRTHDLTPSTEQSNDCKSKDKNDKTESYCPFPPKGSLQADTTSFKRMRLWWDPGIGGLPNYMPLWSVAVDSSIMKNHDDFWNPRIVRLISLLFVNAYRQTEDMHGRYGSMY